MAIFTHEQRKNSVQQMLASWAIEGFVPDADYLALLDRYIEGELTLGQVGKVLRASARKTAVVEEQHPAPA